MGNAGVEPAIACRRGGGGLKDRVRCAGFLILYKKIVLPSDSFPRKLPAEAGGGTRPLWVPVRKMEPLQGV